MTSGESPVKVNTQMQYDMPEQLFSEDDIKRRIAAMAGDISRNMPADTMIISLLKGGFVFTADLIRALHRAGMQPQVDFITLASYGAGTSSSGNPDLHSDMQEDIKDRHILIVDDILESGRTISRARKLALERGASEVKIAVLLEKPGKREVDIKSDFTGFVIPDKFVVGYGLDYANRYRELPYIGWLDDL